jgi:hypothetical protein
LAVKLNKFIACFFSNIVILNQLWVITDIQIYIYGFANSYTMKKLLLSLSALLIFVQVFAQLAPPKAASTQNFCKVATVLNLTAMPDSNCSIHWYNSPTGGRAMDVDENLSTGIYYVSQSKVLSAIVSTYAGDSTGGYKNGYRLNAKFGGAVSIVFDRKGNIIVGDYFNERIRKIDTAGYVSTIAGNGLSGWTEGKDTTVKLDGMLGLAVDSKNNIYIADNEYNVIRIIDTTGYVSRYAGDGSNGVCNGPRKQACFAVVQDISSDSHDNLYVAEHQANDIRKINTAGIVSTYAGLGTSGFIDGQKDTARLGEPTAIGTDFYGNVYVGEIDNRAIRKITTKGFVKTLAGAGTKGYKNGKGKQAMFGSNPRGLACDKYNNVYVADVDNNCIRIISPYGDVKTFAGRDSASYRNGVAADALFYGSSDIAIDSSGNLYIACGNVRKIDVNTIESSRVAVQVNVNPTNDSISNTNGTLSITEPNANYQWLLCNMGSYSAIAGQTAKSFKPITTGSYAIAVQKNGCADTSACYYVNITGINELETDFKIAVYPNPSNGFFKMEYNITSNSQLNISNILSQQLYTCPLNKGKGEINIEKQFPKGIYFLKIGNSIIKKLVIE